MPLIQLILYQSILNKYHDLFTAEECRITQCLKDFEINNKGNDNNYIVVNYKGLLKLHNKSDTAIPKKCIDENLRIANDIKDAILKQIRYDLQTKFVIPLKNIFETAFKEILVDVGCLESPVVAFLNAIKGNCFNHCITGK